MSHSRSASGQSPPALFVTPSSNVEQQGGVNNNNNVAASPASRSPSYTSDGAYPPPASPRQGGKGHSPTKSVDTTFQTKLELYAREQQKNLHSRRASELDGTTAVHGDRAKEELNHPDGIKGAGEPVRMENRRVGFLSKIPLLKYMAPKKDVEVDEDGEVVEKGKVITDLPDPSPQEMGVFRTLPPSTLYHLIDPKSVDHLSSLGGASGLLEGLHTNPATGLRESNAASGTSIDERRKIYGQNRLPERKGKTLLQLMWIAYQDKVLLLLSVAAVISLALGVYQAVGVEPHTYVAPGCPGPGNTCTLPQVEWVEGVAITVAIFIVVMVGSLNDYQKERQFQKLNAQKEARNVKCIRDGSERLMSVYDIVVGDICLLEPGEIVPVDGVFLSGHNVKCDESSATGESDLVRKAPYDEVLAEQENKGSHAKMDPFLLSGSKVSEGSGAYVVTSVGQHSFLGKIMLRAYQFANAMS